MTKESIASADFQLFANKGKARPASALRAIYPGTERDEEAGLPAVSVHLANTRQSTSTESELAEAASLQVGGFTAAVLDEPTPSIPDVVDPDGGDVSPEMVSDAATAGPADIDGALAEADEPAGESPAVRTSALLARSGHLHLPVIAAAFAALLLASLGIGYGLSLIAGGGTPDADAAPPETTRGTPSTPK